MRLSVDKTDIGFHERAMFGRVFLNGEAVSGCITADEDNGFVDICKDGYAKRLFGKVNIKFSGGE